MPQRNISFSQGSYYHIYNRTPGVEHLFVDDENFRYCLRLIKHYSQICKIAIIAYCLMPSHYHLCVRQDSQKTVSEFISHIFITYVQAFNKRHQRHGTLFSGRFKHRLIEKDEYLIQLCCYIHLNPVRAHLVTKPENWLYSNYLEWIDQRKGGLIDHEFINEQFPNRDDYRIFVQSDLDDQKTKDMTRK
jgi:putative transposase